MKQTSNYRAIIHGPMVWKGATRAADADLQTPFIVAFEPQNGLLVVQQGTCALDELIIDSSACDSQILSLFFFETEAQALEAEKALSRSLGRLQTLYDVFMSTRVLEILEQVLGSVHIPLQIVAKRTTLLNDKQDSSKIVEEASYLHNSVEPYIVRVAVSQGLCTVTPEKDLIDYIKGAIGRKGPNVNRISISFYYVTKGANRVQTPANINTPHILRKSAKSTPRNLTRATTPCARLGKAVVDLYSMRGLICHPNVLAASTQGKASVADVSPIIKAALSSQEQQEAIEKSGECLRSLSQDQYVSKENLSNAEAGKPLDDLPGMVISSFSDSLKAMEQANPGAVNDIPPTSERTNGSGASNAVDIALKLFDEWNFEEYEVINNPDPVIQIPKTLGRKEHMKSMDGTTDKLMEENKELAQRNAENMEEIRRLRSKVSEAELKLRGDLKSAKDVHDQETARLTEVLREKERILTEINAVGTVDEIKQREREVHALNEQLDSAVLEKNELLKQVQQCKEENQHMLKELESLKLTCSDMKNKADELLQFKRDKEQELGMMQERISTLQMEKLQLIRDVNNYKEKKLNMESALENAKKVETKLKDDVSKLEGYINHLDVRSENVSNSAVKTSEVSHSECKLKETHYINELNQERNIRNSIEHKLDALEVTCRQLRADLDAEHGTNIKLKECLREMEIQKQELEEHKGELEKQKEELQKQKHKLENQLKEARIMANRTKLETTAALEKCYNDKVRYEKTSKEYESKCRLLEDRCKSLQTKLDCVNASYDDVCLQFGGHIAASCINKSMLKKKLENSSILIWDLTRTVLKSKSNLARRRCQVRSMARVLRMPDTATTKQVVAKLEQQKFLDSATEMKINNYDKLRASHLELKEKIKELEKMLEVKKSSYQKLMERHDQLKQENRRISTALAQERNSLAHMESVAKKQVKDELAKTNEERRVLYAKQCELLMQNEDLKEKIGSLKQQLTAMRMNSIDANTEEKYSRTPKCSSIDAHNLVIHKLHRMRTVFDKDETVIHSLRPRMSDTTLEDGISIDGYRSIDLDRSKPVSKPIIPTSPCAYKDTKASLYSRMATLERMRSRQLKSEERNDDVFIDATGRPRKPWVF